MQPFKITRLFVCVLVATTMLLIILMAGFQTIPWFTGSDAQYINQAGLQRTRSQAIAASVLILAYRPVGEKAVAINTLQVVLPLFQQEQNLLLTNNSSDVQLMLYQARPDYLALVSAVKAILSLPDPKEKLDPVQVDIVLNHDTVYLTTMNNLLLILQQQADRSIL